MSPAASRVEATNPEMAMARKDRVVASLAVARVADPAAVTARRARVVVAAPVAEAAMAATRASAELGMAKVQTVAPVMA